jgi:hypothetical protein
MATREGIARAALLWVTIWPRYTVSEELMALLIGALREVSDAQLYEAAVWIAQNHRHAPVPAEIKERALFMKDRDAKNGDGKKYITYWDRSESERKAIDEARRACMSELKRLGMSGVFEISDDTPLDW